MLVRQDEQFTWDNLGIPQQTALLLGLESPAITLPTSVLLSLNSYSPATSICALPNNDMGSITSELGLYSVSGSLATTYATDITTVSSSSLTSITPTYPLLFEPINPLATTASTSAIHTGLLPTLDPLGSMTTTVTQGDVFQPSVIHSSSNVNFVFLHSLKGTWYTITLPFRHVIKQVVNTLKAAFHGAGDWINQYAIITFIRSRPRILLN